MPRVEPTEERRRDLQPRHRDRITAVHHGGKTRVGRDHRGGGDVAPLAHILGKRRGDERVDIEAGQGEVRGVGG